MHKSSQLNLCNYTSGRFNGKVYGKNTYSIYVDNEQIKISKEEKTAIENYVKKFDEYNEKVRKIKEEL